MENNNEKNTEIKTDTQREAVQEEKANVTTAKSKLNVKLIAIISAAACALIALVITLIAVLNIDRGFEFELEIDGKSYVLTGYTGDRETVKIPTKYEGLPVSKIGDRAFEGNTTVKQVVIPEGVITVQRMAFWNCTSLQVVSIPNSVAEIDGLSFMGCYSLRSLTVKKDNTRFAYEDGCLIDKESKTLVVATTEAAIPDDGSVTSIGDFALNGRGISYIIIPKSVVYIGNFALDNIPPIESVYYCGSKTEFESVAVGESSEQTQAKETYFYSESEPSGEGNFWHYVDGAPTIWQ